MPLQAHSSIASIWQWTVRWHLGQAVDCGMIDFSFRRKIKKSIQSELLDGLVLSINPKQLLRVLLSWIIEKN